jgi:hypothetical protein
MGPKLLTYELVLHELEVIYNVDLLQPGNVGWNTPNFVNLKLNVMDISKLKLERWYPTKHGRPRSGKAAGWNTHMRARFVAALVELARRARDHAVWELKRHEGLRKRATPLTSAADVAAVAAAAASAATEAAAAEMDAAPPADDDDDDDDDDSAAAGPSAAAPEPASASPARAPQPARRALSPPRSPPKAALPASAVVSVALLGQQPKPKCTMVFSGGKACVSDARPCDNGSCGPSHCRLLQERHGCFPCSVHPGMTPAQGPFPPLRAAGGAAGSAT